MIPIRFATPEAIARHHQYLAEKTEQIIAQIEQHIRMSTHDDLEMISEPPPPPNMPFPQFFDISHVYRPADRFAFLHHTV